MQEINLYGKPNSPFIISNLTYINHIISRIPPWQGFLDRSIDILYTEMKLTFLYLPNHYFPYFNSLNFYSFKFSFPSEYLMTVNDFYLY